jgi:hypothetical protein
MEQNNPAIGQALTVSNLTMPWTISPHNAGDDIRGDVGELLNYSLLDQMLSHLQAITMMAARGLTFLARGQSQ